MDKFLSDLHDARIIILNMKLSLTSGDVSDDVWSWKLEDKLTDAYNTLCDAEGILKKMKGE